MHQIRFQLELRPRPRWMSLQRLPQIPLLYLKGLLLRGGRERGAKGKGKEGEGRDLAHPKISAWRRVCSYCIALPYSGMSPGCRNSHQLWRDHNYNKTCNKTYDKTQNLKIICRYNKQPYKSCTTVAALINMLL